MKRLFVPCLLLAGCTASPYQPELAGQAVATLRLASVHSAASRVAVLDGECVPFVRADWDKRAHPIAQLKDSGSVYQKVPAGKPLALAFFTSTTTVEKDVATDAVCAVAMRFNPESGADYEAVFSGDGDNCRLEIGKMRPQTGSGARTEPVPGAAELPGC